MNGMRRDGEALKQLQDIRDAQVGGQAIPLFGRRRLLAPRHVSTLKLALRS